MPSWTYDKAPTWAPKAVATDRGWVDAKTGEILVATKKLNKAKPYESLFDKGGKPKKMGRGGARPGAGRPRKKVKKPTTKVKSPKVDKSSDVEAQVESTVQETVDDVKAEETPKSTKKKPPAKKKVAPKHNTRAKKVEVDKDEEH